MDHTTPRSGGPAPQPRGDLPLPAMPGLRVDYVADASDASLRRLLGDRHTLAVLGFGDGSPMATDPRFLRVPLQPHGAAPLEVWRSANPVRHGHAGDVAWAEDGALQFGAIEIDEADCGDADAIDAAAEAAYRRLLGFLAERGYPHPLRIWHYLDAITQGEGDEERYRRFCVGRATGLGAFDTARLPAATAIGCIDGRRRLQVYWLAAKVPGIPLENPRQLSAYRYPRRYGPQPPSFARAMLPPAGSDMPLLLSGTAAIVGHESRHADALATQLDETLANFASLLEVARRQRPGLPDAFGAGSRLKVYVRDAADLATAAHLLEQRLPPEVPRVILHAAVCRRELRVEIDGVHAAAP